MSLLETIETARKRLKSGRLTNEQHVKNTVIEPILASLGWDPADMDQVVAEYATQKGWVDYALIREDRPDAPLVLIEAKAHNKITEDGRDQLFNYAYRAGAGILVLTDGRKWELYLAQMLGMNERERLFCELDLIGDSPSECEQFLSDYLSKENIYEQKAFESAQIGFQRRQDRYELRAALPSVWETLKKNPPLPLYELMSRAIANAGLKDHQDIVAEFISRLEPGQLSSAGTSTSPRLNSAQVAKDAKIPTNQRPSRRSSRKPSVGYTVLIGYTLDNVKYNTESVPETMQKLFSALITRDPEFVSKLRQSYPKWFGEKRKFIANSPEEVYQNIDSYGRSSAKQLDSGQYIDTSFSFKDSVKRIKKSCEVAGLRYDTDLILHSEERLWKGLK